MVVRVRLQKQGGGDGRGARRALRVVDSVAAVAEFAGVTVPSASAWFERGAPVMPDGRYDLWEITRWHALNLGGADGATGARPDGQESKQQAERRLRIAQADSAELEVKVRRGEVVSVVERDRDLMDLIDSFVSALENMPGRVTPLLVAARGYQEVDQILRDHIRSMRIQLVAQHSPKEVGAVDKGKATGKGGE